MAIEPPRYLFPALAGALALSTVYLAAYGSPLAPAAATASSSSAKKGRKGVKESGGDSGSESDGESEDEDKSEKEARKKRKKAREEAEKALQKANHYRVTREFWSLQTSSWEARKNTDDEEEGKDVYFVIKRRTYPKTADWEGYQDYCAVQVVSKLLASILRDVLTEVEAVFEEEPELDGNVLFMRLDDIKARLEKGEKEVEVKEAEEKAAKEKESKDKDKGEKKDDEAEKEDKDADEDAPSETPAAKEGEIVDKDAEKAEGDAADKEKEKAVVAAASLDEEVPLTLAELKDQLKHLSTLVNWVTTEFKSTRTKLDRFLGYPVPQVSFALLWALFQPGSLVEMIHGDSGHRMAFRFKSGEYESNQDGVVYVVRGMRNSWTGTKMQKSWIEARISKFTGLRAISGLACKPLTDKHKDELRERGRLYVALAKVAFLQYEGVVIQVSYNGMTRQVNKIRAEGRAVVDVMSYKRLNPSRAAYMDYDNDYDDYDSSPTSSVESNQNDGPMDEEELVLFPPTVYGFALAVREWGELVVDDFKDISFREEALEQLVIDPDYKDLIRSLVQANQMRAKSVISTASPFKAASLAKAAAVAKAARAALTQEELEALPASSGDAKATSTTTNGEEEQPGKEPQEFKMLEDVVSSKGNGLILVLHGRPGVGKTLTAEAISEYLKTPLYSVGAGELGVDAGTLERRLKDVLDLAGTWGSVLLIDEADIFLEERAKNDVGRNSMVSVFLRLLESFSGVLILTTNRLRHIDEAFLSRFSIAITYPDLDVKKRKMVWQTFLELAGVHIEGVTVVKEAITEATVELEEEEKEVAKGKKMNGLTNGTATPPPAFTITAKYLNQLAEKSVFNGRSIKNVVRTAQALSVSKGVPLNREHLEKVIKISAQFLEDFKDADEAGIYDATGEGWKDQTRFYA